MEQIPVIQTLSLELTNICQNSCAMCWAQCPRLNAPRHKGLMEYELFKNCVDDLLRDAPPQAHLHVAPSFAGESLLHPEYDRCLTYLARFPRIDPMIYTNGIELMKHRDALRFARFINVSVHRQGYDEMLASIREIRRRSWIAAHIVEGEFTRDELVKIQVEVGRHAVIHMHQVISEDLQMAQRFKGDCIDPWHYLAVLWDGETLPCCHLLSPGDFTMGNASEAGLYGVWEGERYTRLRGGDLRGLPCENCRLYEHTPKKGITPHED